ncbi:hypothetical protein GIB67_023002, partial [Kingdonia uniflora]
MKKMDPKDQNTTTAKPGQHTHRITTCLRGWQTILTQMLTATNQPAATSNNTSVSKGLEP